MFCTKCGNKIEESDAFCTACGEKVVNMQDDVSGAAQQAAEPQAAQPASQATVAQSEPKATTQALDAQSVQQAPVAQSVAQIPAQQSASQASVQQPQQLQQQQQPQPQPQPVQQVQQAPVQATTASGMPVNPAPIQAHAVAAAADAGASGREISMPKTKKKGGATKIIVIILVIALIAAAAATAILTNGFGLMGASSKGSVNEYTWDELSQISAEIAAADNELDAIVIAKKYNLVTPDGNLDGTQVKDIQLTNGQSAQVQIAGFWHDEKSDGSGKAGITFIFKDCITQHEMNADKTNAGGWEKSQMRSWLASDGLSMLPEDIQGNIVAVNKLTNNTGETKDASSVSSTSDKLWLYSATELCGNIDWYSSNGYDDGASYDSLLNSEDKEYKLFRDAGVNSKTSNAILVKNFDGTASNWWERSPRPNYPDFFYSVGSDGYPYGDGSANGNYGVVPGFCI